MALVNIIHFNLALMVSERLQDIRPFKFLEINGMKLTEPGQAYPALWEFIADEKVTSRHALTMLEEHFKTPTPGRETWYAERHQSRDCAHTYL